MTFDELFSEFKITTKERRELVFYLAHSRSRETLKALLDAPQEAEE